MIRRMLLLSCLIGMALPVFGAQTPAARADAASMQQKLITIVANGERPVTSKPRTAVRTALTEREVNAFFLVHGPVFMPEGVMEPQVTIEEAGRVRARAIVDLDKALKPKERSWLDPLAWVGGKVEVTAAGRLQSANGRGTFAVDTTTLGGVSVPKSLLQELVTYYSKSPEQPEGFNLDSPFDLPSGIRAVETRRGQATIVQ